MKPSVAERLYALSLYLYPAAFRREFGEAMQQAFRDRLHEGRTRRRLFLELVRDTASSAVREHAQSTEAMRMFVLLVLMLAAAVIVVRGESLRLALVDRIVDHQESAAKAAYHAYDQAVHDFTAAIADAYAAREDARSQLAAAQFYGAYTYFFDVRSDENLSAEPDVAAYRAQHADAATARALRAGWDDPVVLWNAVAGCPARPVTCRTAAALAQLKIVAPENGAVWWPDLMMADRAKDAVAIRAAMKRLASSREFTVYENDMTALWSRGYASVAPPVRASSILSDISSTDAVVAEDLNTRVHYLEWPIAKGAYAFKRACTTNDAALLADCRRAAELLARSRIFATRLIGLSTLARLEPDDAEHWRAAWRAAMWSRAQFWKLLYQTQPDNARWLAALRDHGNVADAADAILPASDRPTPPPDWNDGWTLP